MAQEKPEVVEIDALPVSKELKKRWSYFIRKVYETDPLTCSKCKGEMRIICLCVHADRSASLTCLCVHAGPNQGADVQRYLRADLDFT